MLNTKEDKEIQTAEDEKVLEEMVKAGLHFGHKKNKKNPKMEPYLFGVRNGVNVIDLYKTKEMLDKALDFLSKSVSQNKTVLLVGTKVQLKALVKEIAEECQIPYVNERWLGGTITNFDIIKKRVDHLKDLEKKREEGELEKYTKKERLDIDREIEALKIKFDGLKSLAKKPDIVIVLDMIYNDLAIKEAKDRGVKVIAIADTNANPEVVDYPIPANYDALPSVKYILERIKEVIEKAKIQAQKEETEEK